LNFDVTYAKEEGSLRIFVVLKVREIPFYIRVLDKLIKIVIEKGIYLRIKALERKLLWDFNI
jgi:hypothetical protein